MLEFDFRNLALNASSRSQKKIIVFLCFSDEIVGILIFLSVLRGLTRTEIEIRFRGIMKVRNLMSQNLKESIEIIMVTRAGDL